MIAMYRLAKPCGVLLILALAACAGGRSEPSSQVVARVNGTEITVSQLRAALQVKGGDTEATPEMVKQTVDALVNEQLLLDAAMQNKLDRDPVVVQTLEGARRQLLARAYIERMVLPKEQIDAAAQTDYYKKNPALFQQRKVYQVKAYIVPRVELGAEIASQLKTVQAPEKIEDILTAHNVPYEAQTLTRAAEQLPLEQLPKFTAAKVGDLVQLEPRNGELTLMWIAGIQESPLAFERAQPIIQQYLLNVRNVQALDAYLRQARSASKIDYDSALGAISADAGIGPQSSPQIAAQSSRLKQGEAVLN